MNLQYRPVRREERDVHSSSLLIDVYFSDVSLRRQASMTQKKKFLDPFCSRAMLICSIIWLGKWECCAVVLRVQVLRWTMRLPVFGVADLYCLKLFLR